MRTKQETFKHRKGPPAIKGDASFSKRVDAREQTSDIMYVMPNEFIDLPMGEGESRKRQPLFERLKKIPEIAYEWGLDHVPGKDDISRA